VRDAHLDARRALLALVVGVGLDRAVHRVDLLPGRLEVRAVGEVARGRPERRLDGDVLGGHLDEHAEPAADQGGDDHADRAQPRVLRVPLLLAITPVVGVVDDLGSDLEDHDGHDEQHECCDEQTHDDGFPPDPVLHFPDHALCICHDLHTAWSEIDVYTNL